MPELVRRLLDLALLPGQSLLNLGAQVLIPHRWPVALKTRLVAAVRQLRGEALFTETLKFGLTVFLLDALALGFLVRDFFSVPVDRCLRSLAGFLSCSFH
jgi:hypothetical protein